MGREPAHARIWSWGRRRGPECPTELAQLRSDRTRNEALLTRTQIDERQRLNGVEGVNAERQVCAFFVRTRPDGFVYQSVVDPPAAAKEGTESQAVGQHALQSTVPILVDVGDQVGVSLGHIGQITRVLGCGGLGRMQCALASADLT